MNKKGIFATILVIQLIFLVLLTIFVIQNEKSNFEYEKEYRRLAAYRINAYYEDIEEDLNDLKTRLGMPNGVTQQTIDDYIAYVNQEFAQNNLVNIELNESYLKISDSNLEIVKEGWLS